MRHAAAWLLLISLTTPGCGISEKELNRPVQEQLDACGRILGQAFDARIEALELKRALVKRDPTLAAELGTEAEVLKKLERARAEQRDLEAELRRLKAKYPVEGGS